MGAKLVEGAAKSDAGSTQLRLVVECLTNLVKKNRDVRRRLVRMKGIILVVGPSCSDFYFLGAILPNYIFSHFAKETPVYQAAIQMTNALFSEAAVSPNWQGKSKAP